MKKFTVILLCVILLTGIIACNNSPKQKEDDGLKVALAVSGPINDGGFCAAAYAGLQQAEQELGIEISYTENVATTDIEAIFTDYAAQGYDLIIGHGFQFGDPALKVSEQFPETKFVCINAVVSANNVASYAMGMQDATYLMGVLAANMTQVDKIGMVAGIEGPSQIKLVEGFKAGARSINPDIEIYQAYTGSFTDVGKAKDAADAMISSGADVLAQCANQSGVGVIKAAEESGIYAIGDSVDQNYVAPNTVLCSTVYNIPKLVFTAIDDVANDRFEGGLFELGMAEGIVSIAPYHSFDDKISSDIKEYIEKLKGDITTGKFQVPKIETITD